MREQPWAIGYARVSSTKQAAQGDSLDLQAELIKKAIQATGSTIVPDGRVLQEPFTGTTEHRPVYQGALRFIKEHPGKVKFFVIRSIDRFTREGSLQYQRMEAELTALGVSLRDCSHVIQPRVNTLDHLGVEFKWSWRKPSGVSEVVLAEVGRDEVTTLLTRTIGAEIALVRAGYHVGPANDGYVVRRIYVEGKKRCAQFPDPERAEFVRTIFAMRADGTHSDEEIVAHVNSMGYRSRVHNRWDSTRTKIVGRQGANLLTVKQLQRLVARPVYCGVILHEWTNGRPIRAQGGEALVSIEIFNRANRGRRVVREEQNGSLTMLYDQKPERVIKRRHKFSQRWKYKNVAMCPCCGRALWASASRGKSGKYFAAYHCTNGHGRYAVPQKRLDAAFDAFVERLRLVPEFWDGFAISVVAEYKKAIAAAETDARRSDETISRIEAKQEQLAEAFALATSDTMRSRLERQVQELDVEIASLRSNRVCLDVSSSDVDEFLKYTRRLLEHPAKILGAVTNMAEQIALYSIFFERFPSLPEIETGTPKLRPLFSVFCPRDGPAQLPAGRQSLDWNTVCAEMDRWKAAYWAIESVIARMETEERGNGRNEDEQEAA